MKHILILAAFAAGSAFAGPEYETITSHDELLAVYACQHDGYRYFAQIGQLQYACIRDFREAMLAREHMRVQEIASFIKARSRLPVEIKDGKVVNR